MGNETQSAAPRPVQNPGESEADYQARLEQWQSEQDGDEGEAESDAEEE